MEANGFWTKNPKTIKTDNPNPNFLPYKADVVLSTQTTFLDISWALFASIFVGLLSLNFESPTDNPSTNILINAGWHRTFAVIERTRH